jgi:hypothetical protein
VILFWYFIRLSLAKLLETLQLVQHFLCGNSRFQQLSWDFRHLREHRITFSIFLTTWCDESSPPCFFRFCCISSAFDDSPSLRRCLGGIVKFVMGKSATGGRRSLTADKNLLPPGVGSMAMYPVCEANPDFYLHISTKPASDHYLPYGH